MQGIYGKPGESTTYSSPRDLTDPYVLMNKERPSGRYICSTEGCTNGFGVWELQSETRAEYKEKLRIAMEEQGASGVLTDVKGIIMQSGEADRKAIAEGYQWMKESGALVMAVRDIQNVMHTVTLAEFKTIYCNMGAWYAEAWFKRCVLLDAFKEV